MGKRESDAIEKGERKEEINFEEFKRKVSKLKDSDFPLYKELKDSLS